MGDQSFMEYKRFFDECPIALVRTCINTGKFLLANLAAAKMLGYDSVEKLIENQLSITLYPKETRKRLIDRIRRSGDIKEYEIKLRLHNGKEIWVSANMHINCGGTCIEGSLIDITELVELKQKCLKSANLISKSLDMRLAALN